MAQSIVMSIATVSDFKKYLKECLKTSKVVDVDCKDNVLINLASAWLTEHYSSKPEKFNYHVYLVWFAIRELLQTNFKRDPSSTDTIATALKYPDEFEKCHDVDVELNYNHDSIKQCIHNGYSEYDDRITDAYKIGAAAKVLRREYNANNYANDFSLPEGKEYNGILDGDVIVDIRVHQKSTYDMLCDLKDYLKRCYECNELLPYDKSPDYVDLIDIIIATVGRVKRSYYFKCDDIQMNELTYTIWFAVIVWLLKGNYKGTLDVVESVVESTMYDFKVNREKFDKLDKYQNSFRDNSKEYWRNDKPEYYKYICNIQDCLERFEMYIEKYNNTIKPDDAINPPFDLDGDVKLEHDAAHNAARNAAYKAARNATYKGVSISNIEKLAVYKDKLIEIINNMVGIGTAVKGMVDVFVAGQFDYETFNNAVDILDVIRNEAKECAPQFRIVF